MSFSVSFMVFHFTEKKHHHDPDDDSGMGPSIFTDTKSTTFSEVSYTVCIAVRMNQIGPKGEWISKPPPFPLSFYVLFSSLGSSGQRAKGSGL